MRGGAEHSFHILLYSLILYPRPFLSLKAEEAIRAIRSLHPCEKPVGIEPGVALPSSASSSTTWLLRQSALHRSCSCSCSQRDDQLITFLQPNHVHPSIHPHHHLAYLVDMTLTTTSHPLEGAHTPHFSIVSASAINLSRLDLDPIIAQLSLE